MAEAEGRESALPRKGKELPSREQELAMRERGLAEREQKVERERYRASELERSQTQLQMQMGTLKAQNGELELEAAGLRERLADADKLGGELGSLRDHANGLEHKLQEASTSLAAQRQRYANLEMEAAGLRERAHVVHRDAGVDAQLRRLDGDATRPLLARGDRSAVLARHGLAQLLNEAVRHRTWQFLHKYCRRC